MTITSIVIDRTTQRYCVRLEPDPSGSSQRHFSSRLGAELHAADLAERYGVEVDNRIAPKVANG